MNKISNLIMKYKEEKINGLASNIDLFNIYNSFSKRFPKEYIDIIMYDEFNYICDQELSTKRDHQSSFRNKVIKKYQKCIITDDGELMCEACHIKPFVLCTEEDKYDHNNGLLLTASLHKLFDKYLISINPNTLELEISNQLDQEIYKNVWQYKNKKVILDDKTKIYLEHHYQIFSDYY